MSYCAFCGWGEWVKPPCGDVAAAQACDLNRENCRKYGLKNRGANEFTVVRSVRFQDPQKNKFGAYYERLEVVA